MKSIATFLICVCTITLYSQQKIVLSGNILSDDFSPLSNAIVQVSNSSNATLSDVDGNFKLEITKGLQEITCSFIGLKTQKFSLFIAADTSIHIRMKPNLQLGEITIVDKKLLRAADHEASGIITLRKENFTSLPALLGEHDPIRAVQMQPGVQSGNEGSRGVFVRGGSPDQNLMLVDGTPVYNPAHLYGFLSVFNGDALEKIDVYKDRYPARFGGRLGSVMDIETDAGNPFHIKGSFSIGLLTSRIHLEGPIGKKKNTTFSFSGRVCYIGLFTEPISKAQYKKAGVNGSIGYYFGDINAKIAHHFSENDRLEWSFFSNNDLYQFERKYNNQSPYYTTEGNFLQKVDWANYVSSLKWTHHFGKKWKMENSLSFSQYIVNSTQNNYYKAVDVASSFEYKNISYLSTTSFIRNIAFKSDWKYELDKKQTLRMGASVGNILFQTGKGNFHSENNYYGNYDFRLNNDSVSAIEAFAYIEDEFHPSEKWQLNCGFHIRTYTVEGKTFSNFLPRFSMLFSPVKTFSIRAAASGLSQNSHLLVSSRADVLNDYWVPAKSSAPPETGWNFSAGVIHKLPLNFEWSIDGFYRAMNNLIDYKTSAINNKTPTPWYEQIEKGGKGRAYGAEFYVARNKGRVTGSVAYTLAYSERKYTQLNQGNFFPYKYDRRHNIAIQINFKINEHWEIGASWVYGSGNRITLPVQSHASWAEINYYNYLVQNGYPTYQTRNDITLYTNRNGYQLPAYHHLDVAFTYKKRVKKLEHIFNFSIYNLYNRFNIFSVYSDERTGADGKQVLVYKQLSLFPILPSIAYTIKFGL